MGQRVVLLDSSGILHRMFHGYAQPRVAEVDGKSMDVAALYGYCNYLRTMVKGDDGIEYDQLIHVLDPDGGSHHRFSLYPEYKANRSATHPVLTAQKSLLKPLLEAFGHTVVRRHGVESDDVIGSLAKKYVEQGDEVLIITSDKDLMQLVKDGEVLLARYTSSFPGGPQIHEFYGEAEVEAKMGVRPDQVADFLALTGDASDNIPGVYKVGPGTAAKWLNEHGSLASLMMNADSIKGASGNNLREALPRLKLYRQLTGTLDIDIDIPQAPQTSEEKTTWARAIIACPDFWPNDINSDLRDNIQVTPAKRPAI